jgi:hypothetical protein
MDTLYVEEGLAIYHALDVTKKLNREYSARQKTMLKSPWREAFHSFQKLSPTALKSIRFLRDQQPFLDQVTTDQIRTFLKAPDDVADELSRRLPCER